MNGMHGSGEYEAFRAGVVGRSPSSAVGDVLGRARDLNARIDRALYLAARTRNPAALDTLASEAAKLGADVRTLRWPRVLKALPASERERYDQQRHELAYQLRQTAARVGQVFGSLRPPHLDDDLPPDDSDLDLDFPDDEEEDE